MKRRYARDKKPKKIRRLNVDVAYHYPLACNAGALSDAKIANVTFRNSSLKGSVLAVLALRM